MASTFTTSLKLTKQGTGENNGTWGSLLNSGTIDLIDEAISGVESKALIDGSNTLSFNSGSSDESRQSVIVLTGALTSAASVIMPDVDRFQTFVNNTTGSQTITVKNSSGTGVTVPVNGALQVYCDGTSVRAASPVAYYDGSFVVPDPFTASNIVCSTVQTKGVSAGTVNVSVRVSTSSLVVNANAATSSLTVTGIASVSGALNANVVTATQLTVPDLTATTVSASTGTFNSLTLLSGINVRATVSTSSLVVNATASINSLNVATASITNINGVSAGAFTRFTPFAYAYATSGGAQVTGYNIASVSGTNTVTTFTFANAATTTGYAVVVTPENLTLTYYILQRTSAFFKVGCSGGLINAMNAIVYGG